MSGLRGTLILLVVAAALIVGLMVTRGRPAESGAITEAALDGRPLLSARRITVRPQLDVAPIVLERGDTLTFQLTEPVRDLASAARLELLASVFDTARLTRLYEPDALTPDLLAQLGLDRPQAEFVAEFDGHVVRLELGGEAPLGKTVYVRKNGAVYEAWNSVLTALGGTAVDFREQLVFRTPASAVREVEIVRRSEGEATRIALRRIGMGEWQLTEPLVARADGVIAETLVRTLLGMTVTDFARGNVNPRAAQPDVAIQLNGDAGPETVELWAGPSGTFDGQQRPRMLDFVLDEATYRGVFDVAVARLRSSLLFTVPLEQIAEITIDPGAGAGAPTVLRRGGMDVFELAAPVRTKSHPTAVTELLEALRELAAVEFVDPGADLEQLGLARDYVGVQLVGKMQPRPQVVHVSRARGEVCYAKRADEPHVVAVPARCGEVLRRPWTDYVGRDVFEVLAERVFGVRYRRGDDVRAFTRGADGGWERSGGAPAPEGFADAVSALADLRAESVLDPAALGDVGAAWEIDLLDGSQNVLQTFSVWARDDRALVRVRRVDALFRLGRSDSALILAAGG